MHGSCAIYYPGGISSGWTMQISAMYFQACGWYEFIHIHEPFFVVTFNEQSTVNHRKHPLKFGKRIPKIRKASHRFSRVALSKSSMANFQDVGLVYRRRPTRRILMNQDEPLFLWLVYHCHWGRRCTELFLGCSIGGWVEVKEASWKILTSFAWIKQS